MGPRDKRRSASFRQSVERRKSPIPRVGQYEIWNRLTMKLPLLRTPLRLLCLFALVGCAKPTSPPPQPPQVGVVKVEPKSVPLMRSLIGRLALPYMSANVTARVSGVLIERVYTEGSPVKPGQVLFQNRSHLLPDSDKQ